MKTKILSLILLSVSLLFDATRGATVTGNTITACGDPADIFQESSPAGFKAATS